MTAFSNIAENPLFLVMYLLAFTLLYLGIVKKYEPLLLVPIAFGVLIANFPGGEMGVTQANSEGMVEVNGVMKNIYEMPLHQIAHDLGLMNYLLCAHQEWSAASHHLHGCGSAHRLRSYAAQPQACHLRSSCPDGYLCCVAGSSGSRFHSSGGRFAGHHRWC